MNAISRRGFVECGLCATAGAAVCGLRGALASSQAPRGSLEVTREFPYGDVMYVGLNPWDGIGEQAIDLPASLSPVLRAPEAYRAAIAGRDLVFVPYYTVDTERYSTYFTTA